MGPRLVCLVLAGVGLAIYLAMRASAPPTAVVEMDGELSEELQLIREKQESIGDLPLDCEEPAEPPVIAIRHEVRPGEGKNRLHYWLDEAHGYYVEAPVIEFFYVRSPGAGRPADDLVWQLPLNNYITANETFAGCMDLTDNELAPLGGGMGTTENWGARIVRYGRFCAGNPSRLVARDETGRCLE